MVHPFATKQLSPPADPGNKTDPTDLAAIVRAVVAGYARAEVGVPPRGGGLAAGEPGARGAGPPPIDSLERTL